MVNRALFDFDDDGGDAGYDAAHGATIRLTLRVPATASSWMVQVWDPTQYDPNEPITANPPRTSKNAPLITLVGTTSGKVVAASSPDQEITVDVPASGTHSYIFRSIVDGGRTLGALDRDKIWERQLVVVQGSIRKPTVTEQLQYEPDSWAGLICDLIDLLNAAPLGSAYTTIQQAGVSKPQRTTLNFIGATVTDVAGVTTVTITGGSGAPSGSAVGQTQIWNGSAWTAGALDLADADARTGTLPAANGGTGIAGAGGTANRVLATLDGSTWTATQVALTTMVSGQLPLANFPDGSATSVLGRAAGTSGVQASIAASADGQVLRRAAGALAWGAVDLADVDAVTGTLPAGNGGTGIAGAGGTANRVLLTTDGAAWTAGLVDLSTMVTGSLPFSSLPNGSAASVFGRSAGTAGVMASIVSSADGQVLVRSGGAVVWGAVDLSDADAVTGTLPFARLAAGSTAGQALIWSGSAWAPSTDFVAQNLTTTGALRVGAAPYTTLGDIRGGAVFAIIANNAANNDFIAIADVGYTAADILYLGDDGHENRLRGTQVSIPQQGAIGASAMGAFKITGGSFFTLPASTELIDVDINLDRFVQFNTGALATQRAMVIRPPKYRFVAGSTLALAATLSILGAPAADTNATITDRFALVVEADDVWFKGGVAVGAARSGLSVLGRSANTAGSMAAMVGTADQVLRVNTAGTALGFGTISTAGIADGSITLAKLANATASSVLGRSAATSGVYADIGSSADGQVLRRGASGVIAFGAVDLADADAVTGLLPFANLANGSATSVFGRAGGTTGVQASIAASADGQVLQRVAGALSFSTLSVGVLGGGTAVGQVLLNATGNVPTWGAVDLADTDAVTGLLPLTNLASIAGLSVLARAPNTTGPIAAVTGVDGQVFRVSGTTLGFGTIVTAGIADSAVTLAKIANATASSVLGRSAATSGVYADITSSADGQVLRRGAAGVIAFGAVDLADSDAVTGLLPLANITSLAGLSVLGNATNAGATMAAITGVDGQILRVSGTTLGFGTITTAGIADGSITLAKLANATASSVLGRSAATSGVYADITSSADGQVLRRGAAGVIAFGAVDLADTDAVTGLLPFANIANGSGLSVLGRGTNSAGVMASLVGTADQVLVVNTAGTALAFGTVATAGITDAAVTLAKLANATASSVLGRSAATSGVYADIGSSADGQVLRRGASGVIAFGAVDLADTDAVTGLLPFANVANGSALSVLGRGAATSGVMASIVGAADQVLLVNSAGTALAFGSVSAVNITNGSITLAKLANGTAASVLGRSANSGGVYADIASSADGQVLRRAAAAVTFGAVDLADVDAVTGLLPFANVADGSALSVLGRGAATSGVQASIAGTADQVLRVNTAGTALAFGTVATAGIADANVTLAKLANATASSVLGRSAATTGVYADITSSADGQVLRRGASGVIAFGAVDLADTDAVTGLLPFANIANGSALSVFGRSAGTAGVQASITGTADQVLVVNTAGTAVAFGTVQTAGIANSAVTLAKIANGSGASVLGRSALASGVYADIVSSANGQVLVRAGGTIIWGAIDLADADAVSGLLPLANLTPSGTNGRLMTTLSGVAAWSASVGNSTDAFVYNGLTHSFQVAGTARLDIGASAITLNLDTFYFLSGVVNPNIGQQSSSTAAGTGQTLTVLAQNQTGTGATTGGALQLLGGSSTNGVGGGISVRSGVGSTAIKAGNWQAYLGNTVFLNWAGADPVASIGTIRMPSGGAVYFRNVGNSANIVGMYTDSSNTLYVGGLDSAGLIMTAPAMAWLTTSGVMTFDSTGVLNLCNASAAPSSNPGSGVQLYCIAGELWVRGGSGTIKKLAEA